MHYTIEFKPGAQKDFKNITALDSRRIIKRIEMMSNNLQGDVKELTDHAPEYRLRVGNYRILFEINANKIVIYRIRHRKDAYR